MSGRRIADYEILEELGEGSYATVYLAQREGLPRKFAVKLLKKAKGDDASRARFLREARLASRLNHPNIVSCFDLGVVEDLGWPYLVMDYVPGKTLADRIKDEGALPIGEACGLMIGIADAVQYAHESDVIHRDIKPANIIIREKDGRPMVSDFGLARDQATTADLLTRTGDMVGTPAYMAPEQLQREKVDARTDIYALGLIFYEMLTGTRPYRGRNIGHLVDLVLEGHVEAPNKRRREIPAQLNAACLKAMARNPEDRFQAAAALAHTLREITADPTSGVQLPADRLAPATSPKAIVAATACVLAMVLLAIVWTISPGDSAPDSSPTASPGPSPTITPEPIASALQDPTTLKSGDPDLDAHLAAIRESVERGNLQAAERRLDRAREAARHLPNARDRIAAMGERIDRMRDEVKSFIRRVDSLHNEFRAHEALKLAVAEVRRRPESAMLRLVLAKLMGVHGCWADARDELDAMFRIEPESRGPHTETYGFISNNASSMGDLVSPLEDPLWKSWVAMESGLWETQPDGSIRGSLHGGGPFQYCGLIYKQSEATSRFRFSVEVKLVNGTPGPYAGIAYAARDLKNHFLVYLFWEEEILEQGNLRKEDLDRFVEEHGHPPQLALRLARFVDGRWRHMESIVVPGSHEEWNTLEVKVTDREVVVFLNGKPTGPLKVRDPLSGRAGLMKFYDTEALYRNWRWTRE